MRDDSRIQQFRRAILRWLSTNAYFLLLVLACCTCLLVAYGGIVVVQVLKDIEPVQLLDTEIPVDTSSVPLNSTEKDWYPIAVQVLASQGWDLPPHLVLFGSPITRCSPPFELDRVNMEFSAVEWEGLFPYVKVAEISFVRSAGNASVRIWVDGPRLTTYNPVLDLAKMQVDAQKALELAERYGGQEHRDRVQNRCQINIQIVDDLWRIRYWDPEHLTDSEFWIEIDAKTGQTRRVW
jgi:hypothetical protein